MSEPVTNAEIEDVLSSIRRLISENPGSGSREAGGQPGHDKLVLTPAFRVLDGEAATPAPEDREQDSPLEKAEQVTAPETPEQEPASRSTLEQRIAELEAAIGESFEEWEPDGSEAPEEGGAPIILHRVPSEPAQDSPEPFEQSQDRAPEPPAAGLVLEAEEVPEEQAEEMAEPPAGDDMILDEDALRDLVSELVREQLQGQIGEKITRSIRRMVRREIRLALSVRDME